MKVSFLLRSLMHSGKQSSRKRYKQRRLVVDCLEDRRMLANVMADFNGDGFDDLAVGSPGEGIGGVNGAGSVHIIYGTAAGLSATDNQVWHQNSPGILGVAEDGDGFGNALAAGDFDNDGFDDLAIAVAAEDDGAIFNAGAVQVLYGSATGLGAARDQNWHQNSPGILGVAEADDFFGDSLAAGDFNGDGVDDLAVGASGEAIGALADAGAVHILFGSDGAGLVATDNQLWHQNSAGIDGVAETDDSFGFALAAGDFNDDSFDDLAIAAAGEGIGALAGAGQVHVLYGTLSGLAAAGSQVFHENTAGLAGVAEAGDAFGAALAAGDLNGDGADDLAIGIPLEDIGARADAGSVAVLYSAGGGGLSTAGSQVWHQNSPGILGVAEDNGAFAGDSFGAALAAGDFNGDTRDDLAIGVPGEWIGNIAAAGGVNVIYGTALGLDSAGNQFWQQNSLTVLGIAEQEDFFGAALSVGNFNRSEGDTFDDLAIGVPGEGVGSKLGAGQVNVLYGAASGLDDADNQQWFQGGGLLGVAETGDAFGKALVGSFSLTDEVSGDGGDPE